ncbi:MAG: cation:proton antiporter [Bacteroidaceae bacterium]|nr:cation:proton antiporter [Bacteroidaceae bacterium]
MSELEPMIADLALILICAGVMTLIFKRLKQPLVLGYIVAGFLASPNMPYMPSVTDLENVHLWSDIGVIFLLFALGLEFSFKKIVKMGAAPIISACTTILSMMVVGAFTGYAFGWGQMDCIYLGGMLAMSSTTIIFKAFDDMGLRQQRFAGMVLSVLIIEDILAIVLMVMLSTLAVSQQFEGIQMATSILKLLFFLVLWFVVGIYLIPLFLGRVKSLMSDETMLILVLGLCFGMVVLASSVGFSAAFGAFIMGSILAETIEAEKIEHLVSPVKDLFGAIFFVSVGMMVDVALIVEYIVPILCIIAAIMVGQTVFSTAGFLLSGQPLKTAMQCSFSLTQIGEFAFILATLGTSLGVTSDFLYPIVVAVSVFTTFTTPYMIRLAEPAYTVVERHLPVRWKQILERLANGSPNVAGQQSLWRTYLKQVGLIIVIYGVLCDAIIVVMFRFVQPFIEGLLPNPWNEIAVATLTIVFLSPFLRSLMMKRNRNEEFQALWADNNFNRAPLIAVQLLRIVMGAAILSYVLGHTVHWSGTLGIFVVIAILFTIILSRNLKKQGMRLEQTFHENLTQRERRSESQHKRPQFAGRLLERDVHLSDFSIPVGIDWGGQTLAQLNLGKKFGIHVVSVQRGTRRINIPSASTLVLPGDHLQVVGSDQQLATFGQVLESNIRKSQEATATTTDEMKLRRVLLEFGSPFVGKTIRDSGIRDDYRCLIVGIEAEGDQALHSPNPTQHLHVGDIIWVVGEEADLTRLEQAKEMPHHISIGAGVVRP